MRHGNLPLEEAPLLSERNSDTTARAPAGTQAIQRASLILKAIGAAGPRGASVAELCRSLGFERPTLHRMLACLLSERLLGRNPATKRFYLGRAMYELGQVAASRFSLREICATSLTRIADRTGDTVFLARMDGPNGLVIDRRDGSEAVRPMPLAIGMRRPLGVGASGLAMLMVLEDDEMRRILSDNAGRLHPGEIPPGGLLRSLQKFRSRGYAISRGYGMPGICGIGMPLRDPDGRPCGAISVTAASPRMTLAHQREVLTVLQGELSQVDVRLRAALA
jgi:DNA-binding IclR family transcriptional regulator